MFKIFLASVLCVLLSNCVSVVKPEEAGLLWNSYTSELKSKNGTVWLNPLTEELFTYSTRWENHVEKVDVITQDDLHIDVVASIIIRPVAGKIRQLHLEIGKDYYKNIVQAEFRTAIRNAMTGYQMIQISKKSPDIEEEVKQLVSKKLESKYLEVSDINIDDINLSNKILRAIEDKLTKQQELESMKYEQKIAERNEEIAKMKAKTEAETEIIRAEKDDKIAKMKAQTDADTVVIHATATSKAQKLINSELTPKYLKLKTLESHYKAFESPNTKIIFIPMGKDGFPAYINLNDRLFMGEETKTKNSQ